MRYSIKNDDPNSNSSLIKLSIKVAMMLMLFVQTLAVLANVAVAQSNNQTLFKSERHVEGNEPRLTFHKTGVQRSCKYVRYKVRFNVTYNTADFAGTGFREELLSVRFNLRDQLPAGLSVQEARIQGDIEASGGGAPAVAIGTIGSPNDTVSVAGFKFDPAAIDTGSLSFELSLTARIDRAAFPTPRSVNNQAKLEVVEEGAASFDMFSHDPATPGDGDWRTGTPTGIVVDLTDCDRIPDDSDTPEDEACFKIEKGEIHCSGTGDGTYTYSMPFGPEMGGRSVELVALTPGVTVNPGAQIVPAGGGVLTWTIFGAVPGTSMTFSVVGTEISAGPSEGWSLCCAQVIEIIIPEEIDCPKPRKNPDLEVKKQALVEQCTLAGGCKFRITVTNRGDVPYTGPIALDEVVAQGPAKLEGSPNAPWTCVPNETPMTCKHPSTTLNPGESVTLEVSLAHLTRRNWNIMTNCAELDYTASNIPTPFGDLTNDKDCASIPIRQPRIPEDPKKADLEILKSADSFQCSYDGVCNFTITVRNVGSSTFNGPLVINDTYPTGAPSTSTFAPSPPWTCADTGGGNFRCTTAGNIVLPIGAAMTVSVRATLIPGSYNSRQIENCVVLERVPNETELGNNRACATQRVPGADQGEPELAINKECELTSRGTKAECTITVTNNGSATAVGRIKVDDVALLVSNGEAANIETVTPDGPEWECTPVPAASVYCEIPGGVLSPNDSRSFDVSVSIGRKPARMENCATGSVLPIDNSQAQTFGKACSAVGEDTPEEKLCSPSFVLNDAGRCVCPEGTKYRGGKCVGGSDNATPIPLPTPRACTLLPGQIRTTAGRCVCRRGTILNNSRTRCITPRAEPRLCKLLPGQVRTQAGRCVCRRGTVLNNRGSRCITPRTEPKLCKLLPGQVRTQAGRCVCRRGTVLNRRGTRCIAQRPTCKQGQVYDSRRNRCITQRPTCKRGQVYDSRRNRCITQRPTCKRGQVYDSRRNRCINQIVRKRCPKGTVGRYQPNCRKVNTRPRPTDCRKPLILFRGRCITPLR